MADHPVTAELSQPQAQIIDVWSRTAPKYRRRAVVMLAVLIALFAGLCCFTFWLRTGVAWPPASDRYADLMRRSFNPTGADQITLSDFLTSPINVQRVPVHGVIMGLLFASLGSIPILVAILYRFPCSTIFALMVVFLAAMPWLGLTILAGCVLASVPPLRFSFRYASALMGLLPIAVYFVSASWEPAGARPPTVENRALLYAPWVFALLSSCLICAVALALARLINYRPGGIAPLLAVLFVIPVLLFHWKVGRDELEYRVLAQEVGTPGRLLFVPMDVGLAADRNASRRWSETRDEPYDRIYRRELQKAIAGAFERWESDRLQAVTRCAEFIRYFPGSRYVPNVLYFQGQAQDTRLARSALLEHGRVEYRSDLPSQASRQTWQTLAERFAGDESAAVALYKLAILHTRDGAFDAAVECLNRLTTRFDVARSTTQPPSRPERRSVFQKARPSAELGIDLPVVLLQARRLHEMIAACRGDAPARLADVLGPRRGDPDVLVQPLSLLWWLDDADPGYATNLAELARHFPDSMTAGFVRVRMVLLEPAISRRIARFREAAATLGDRPPAAEALFYLAEVLQEDMILDEARETYERLVRQFPNSGWAAEGKERLASLTLFEEAARPRPPGGEG